MTLQMPIIAYALAEGSGKLAMTPEGKKNASNLSSVSAAMSWIDAQAHDLISVSGIEYSGLETPFEYYEGSRITFEPVSYAKYKLEKILNLYAGRKISLLIPSREALFKTYDDPVMSKIWDRRTHGYDVEILSVQCPDFPLRRSLGILGPHIRDYLIQNAMRTEAYITKSVKGSASQLERPLGKARGLWR